MEHLGKAPSLTGWTCIPGIYGSVDPRFLACSPGGIRDRPLMQDVLWFELGVCLIRNLML